MTPRVSRGAPASHLVDRTIRFVEAARALGSPIIDHGCLTRGLTLYYFLRRAGLDVALCFGVDYGGRTLTGHCWLELDGTPFLEPVGRRRFTEMYRFPAEPAGPRPARTTAKCPSG